MSRKIFLLPLFLLAIQSAGAQESIRQDLNEPTATAQATSHVTELITQKFGVAREKAQLISSAVMSAASKYSLPPALLLAIISIESRFKEKAHGANGATGLMQVVPTAHKQLVRNIDLTEPTANIEAGSNILHGYLKSAQGDLGAALKSYGGSKAYAEKVSLKAKTFEPTFQSAIDEDDDSK